MSPFDSLRGIKNKPEYQALETQRFIRRHNITKFGVAEFESTTWYAFLAPARAAPQIITRLYDAFAQSAADLSVQEKPKVYNLVAMM
jgi:hypothetical protein